MPNLVGLKPDKEGVASLEKSEKQSTTREVGWPLVPQAITPDTPGHILAEISHSPQLSRFKDELIKGAQARQALMILRQTRINQANARIRHSLVEGIGQKVASIDPEIYFQQMLLHGRDCWQQPDFMDKFLRDNPQCRIRYEFPSRIFMGERNAQPTEKQGGAGAFAISSRTPDSTNENNNIQKRI